MAISEATTHTVPHTPLQRRWGRFITLALLLHIPLFVYPVLRLADWLALPLWLIVTILIPVTGSQIVSRIWLRNRQQGWQQQVRKCADFLLGLSPIMLMSLLVLEPLVWLLHLPAGLAAKIVITATMLVGFCGFVLATTPFIKTIRLTSPRLQQVVRFVQITDVHIGSRSRHFLEHIIFRLNRLQPDFLCITGDLIDATGVSESELSSLKTVASPIYFCLGNHEKYEDLNTIVQRLKNLGVQVLRNETRQFRDDIQVIGIDDMEDPQQVAKQLVGIELDPKAFKLLLYHRPRGLAAAAAANIDLMLSGHTHNGQIFPFNWLVGSVFERMKGMYQLDRTKQYVSQGTGTWGPVLRLGTRSEITLFVIEPE